MPEIHFGHVVGVEGLVLAFPDIHDISDYPSP